MWIFKKNNHFWTNEPFNKINLCICVECTDRIRRTLAIDFYKKKVDIFPSVEVIKSCNKQKKFYLINHWSCFSLFLLFWDIFSFYYYLYSSSKHKTKKNNKKNDKQLLYLGWYLNRKTKKKNLVRRPIKSWMGNKKLSLP